MKVELRLNRWTRALYRTRIYAPSARRAALWQRAFGYDHSGRVRALVRRLVGLALIITCTRAAALESWGLPDMRQDDKKEHFAAGYVVSATTDALILSRDWRLSWWQRDLIDVGAATVAGTLKEIRDDHVGRNRATADPKDAIATTMGGAFYVAISHTWRW